MCTFVRCYRHECTCLVLLRSLPIDTVSNQDDCCRDNDKHNRVIEQGVIFFNHNLDFHRV